ALGWKQTGAQVAPPPPPVVAQEDSTSADQQIPVERVQINGRVYDHETGEPVPFARVMVLQTMEGALTDMDGYFVLKIRPETAPAVLNLSIECILFLTVTREVALRTNGVSIPPPSLTIYLTPKQEQVFMGIVVTDSP